MSILRFYILLVCCCTSGISQFFPTKEIELLDFDSETISSCSDLSFDYFDSSSHSCDLCGENQEPNPDLLDGEGNPYLCQCIQGFETIEQSCAQVTTGLCQGFTCNSCLSSGLTSYSDRIGCVGCGSTTLGLGADGECQCDFNQILLERDVTGEKLSNKTCVDCPLGSAVIPADTVIAGKNYLASASTCQTCPDQKMTLTATQTASNVLYVCTCAQGYTLVGVSSYGEQSCVLSTYLTTFLILQPTAVVVSYEGGLGSFPSLTFEHYFSQSVSRCTFFSGPDDIIHCQILANLCVLQLYDDEAQVCNLYLNLITQRGLNVVNDVENWVVGAPWLYFSGSKEVCERDIYDTAVSLNSEFLEFFVAEYHLNGSFTGYKPLETLLTSFCEKSAPNSNQGAGTNVDTRWQIFASSKKDTYQCDLTKIIGTEQYFYELFLYRKETSPGKFSPIPVRILNSRQNGARFMTKDVRALCGGGDLLVRRFFLYDIASGITTDSIVGSDPQVNSQQPPSVLRYTSYISLDISLIPEQPSSIYAPVLTLEYSELDSSAWRGLNADINAENENSIDESNSQVELSFETNYTMNTSAFFAVMLGFFITVFIIGFIIGSIRYYNWSKRNSRIVTTAALSTDFGGLNLSNIREMIRIAVSTWVLVFFPFTVLIAWYFFVFFKLQTVPSIMLPPQDDVYNSESPYYAFVANLHVMAFFQLFYVGILVFRQCKTDVFFIDWEPTKTNENEKDFHVSVWRSILVANEWSELQTIRKIDVRFTLFFLGFFLLGLNLEYNATNQPILSNKDPDELNIILRFANTTFFWLILSFAQYMWKFVVFERYVNEPPERLFIDFCTIAKVSLIILDEKYHGYYLHCRSPHQFADGSMMELLKMLQSEEAGLTIDRSLDDAPKNVQSFQIFLSTEWRTAFDKIYVNLVRPITFNEMFRPENAPSQSGKSGGGRGRRGFMAGTRGGGIKFGQSLNKTPPERIQKAWLELIVFFKEFIENNFGKPGLRRACREPTYYERFTLAGPDLTLAEQPSVFFPDNDFYYTKVIFLGIEMDLMMMNILSYSLFDLWFNNTLVSMLLCYLLDLLVTKIRQYFGQILLSRKTLIDGRFLI